MHLPFKPADAFCERSSWYEETGEAICEGQTKQSEWVSVCTSMDYRIFVLQHLAFGKFSVLQFYFF